MLLLRSKVALGGGVALGGLLAATTLTYAAVKPHAHRASKAATRGPSALVVPDVAGKAYVFAEGMLDDAGFAWRVAGTVHGFAANTVVSQNPAAGTKVVDTGAPVIVLSLERNSRYAETGTAVDAAPFAGTAVRLPGIVSHPASVAAAPTAEPKNGSSSLSSASNPAKPTPNSKSTHHSKQPSAPARPAHATPATTAKPAAHPDPATRKSAASPSPRPRAFTVPGAPKEPLDEMPLPERANLLQSWVAAHPKPTPANVRHWLFQHAWIVTGARFGWWHGEAALQTLIAADQRVERQWHIGRRSEAVARQALAGVRARTH